MAAVVAVAFMMVSCEQETTERDTTTKETTDQEEATPAAEEPQTREVAPTGDTVQIEINSNDQMQFDKTELRVNAGDVVVFTLNHTGKLPLESMGHNWVLLMRGADMGAFARQAMKAKDNDYIPADREGDVIAHTKMLGGGESDTITFQAPAPGTYEFLCSFPGHYMAMNGKFIVE